MSQKGYEISRILEPLQKLYRPLGDDALKLYIDKLERFALDDIRKAVNEVIETWDRATFPPIAAFLKFMNANQKTTEQVTSGKKYPWQERETKIAEMKKAYLKRLLSSEIYRQAEAEKYGDYLRRYAMECAAIQAQIICNQGNIGCNAAVLRINTPEERHRFMQAQHQLCACGEISIEIPGEHIDYWRALVARLEAKKAA